MDIGCNCFGVAAAAKVPVKRYNLLVPAIYPTIEPSYEKPFNLHTEKALKKLVEYLEKNEHRVPKVSRRLARRLYKDVRLKRWAYVRITVMAYIRLMQVNEGQHARVYATELVVHTARKRHRFLPCFGPSTTPDSAYIGSVIGVLLSNSSPKARSLGSELLVEFLKLQDDASFLEQLEGFVPLLARDANLKLIPRKEGTGLGTSSARRSSATAETVLAGALRALLEHFKYCSRVVHVSQHLGLVTSAVLDTIDASALGSSALPEVQTARKALDSGVNPMALRQMSIGALVGSSPPGLAAMLVYEEMGHVTSDAVEGRRLLQYLLEYLDAEPKRWLGGPAVDAGLGSLRQACKEHRQRYIVFSSLVRHAGNANNLPEESRAAVMDQALIDAMALDAEYASAAIILVGQSLVMAVTNGLVPAGESGPMQVSSLKAIRQLSSRLKSPLQLVAVLDATLSQLPDDSWAGATGLRCCASSAEAFASFPQANGHQTRIGGADAPLSDQIQSALLRSLLAVISTRDPVERRWAHKVLDLLPGSVAEVDIDAAFSAVCHEALLSGNTPWLLVAMHRFVARIVETGSAETQVKACRLATTLQLAILKGDSSAVVTLSPTQRCGILHVAAAILKNVSDRVQHAPLKLLAVGNGLDTPLPSLVITSSGLELAEGVMPSDTFDETTCDLLAQKQLKTWRGATTPSLFETTVNDTLGGVVAFKKVQTTQFKVLNLSVISPSLSHHAPSDEVLNELASEGNIFVHLPSTVSSANGPVASVSDRNRIPAVLQALPLEQPAMKSNEDVLADVEGALGEARRHLSANGSDADTKIALLIGS